MPDDLDLDAIRARAEAAEAARAGESRTALVFRLSDSQTDIPALLARLTEVEGERDEARAMFADESRSVVEHIRLRGGAQRWIADLEEDARLLRDERDAAQFELDSLRGRVDALFAAQLEHSRVRQERDALAAENAHLRQQRDEARAVHCFGCECDVICACHPEVVDALQEGPSGPLYATQSAEKAPDVQLTTDGAEGQGGAQGAARAIRLTKDEALARRAKLLASTGLDWPELRRRAHDWNLSPEQRDAYDTIDSLNYLVGDDHDMAVEPPSIRSERGSDRALCGAKYTNPGGDQRGDRIVRCGVEADHLGDHDEMIDGMPGNYWPQAERACVDCCTIFNTSADLDEHRELGTCPKYADGQLSTPADPPWLEEAIEAGAEACWLSGFAEGEKHRPWLEITESLRRHNRRRASAAIRTALPLITQGALKDAADEIKTAYDAMDYTDSREDGIEFALGLLRERAARPVTS